MVKGKNRKDKVKPRGHIKCRFYLSPWLYFGKIEKLIVYREKRGGMANEKEKAAVEFAVGSDDGSGFTAY